MPSGSDKMGKTTKFEKYSLELKNEEKTPENLSKIISEFEKVCLGENSEQSDDLSCNIRKQYGISFINEDEKEIGSVCFNDSLEYKKFCESFEEGTSTFDITGLPIIKYNNIVDPFPFFSYSVDGKNYNHITR